MFIPACIFHHSPLYIGKYSVSPTKVCVLGKKVEFIPSKNYKIGGMVGYKNIFLSIQLTKLGNQFSDASNATSSNLSGVIGEIPEYQVIDFVLNYSLNFDLFILSILWCSIC